MVQPSNGLDSIKIDSYVVDQGHDQADGGQGRAQLSITMVLILDGNSDSERTKYDRANKREMAPNSPYVIT